MPVIPAGNAIGHRQIVFDLSNGGAYAGPAYPTAPSQMQIGHIFVSGVALTGDATITLRTDSASGPIVWQLEANVAANTRFVVSVPFEECNAPIFRGIYVDAHDVWSAGSVMILYKR